MSTTTKGTYKALILPWGERASQFHDEHPGRAYSQGEVHMPRRDLPLTKNHGGPEIGTVSFFASTAEGIEAVIKLGRRGEELLAQGHVALSAEIDEDSGDLIGVALAVHGEPAFRSARILTQDGASFERRGGLGLLDGSVTIGRSGSHPPAMPLRPAMDLSGHRRAMAGFSMAAVEDEVERRRQEFERWQDERPQREVESEEQRLIADGVPVARWPVHTNGRQRWETMNTRQVVETATRNADERYEALAAAQSARRGWWRRWFR